MSVYVLVHGAWHGAWCWERVIPLLEAQGHKVVAPDLPGHGDDTTPIAEVSLQAYVDRVCDVIAAQTEPVILVGHSMGGAVITQAAEFCVEGIQTLVYLSGFLLRDGEYLLQHAQQDADALVLEELVMAEDESYTTISEDGLKPVFYGDCSDQDVARARSRFVPQAMAPFVTPVSTSTEKFGRVPRVFIECLQDRAISPALQRKLYTQLPCDTVISMDTSHSPFYSAPAALATHLLSLATLQS